MNPKLLLFLNLLEMINYGFHRESFFSLARTLTRGPGSSKEINQLDLDRIPVCKDLKFFETLFYHRPNMLLNAYFYNLWERKFFDLLRQGALDELLLYSIDCSPEYLQNTLEEENLHNLECIFVNYVIMVNRRYKRLRR